MSDSTVAKLKGKTKTVKLHLKSLLGKVSVELYFVCPICHGRPTYRPKTSVTRKQQNTATILRTIMTGRQKNYYTKIFAEKQKEKKIKDIIFYSKAPATPSFK